MKVGESCSGEKGSPIRNESQSGAPWVRTLPHRRLHLPSALLAAFASQLRPVVAPASPSTEEVENIGPSNGHEVNGQFSQRMECK